MSIALSGAFKPLQIPNSAIRKLSDDEVEMLQRRQPKAPPPLDVIADNHPSNIYATLERNGQTIATVYKSGGMMTPNAIGSPSNLASDGSGLPLAEQRLQQMLQLHGGTISYAQPRAQASASAATLFAAQLARDGG